MRIFNHRPYKQTSDTPAHPNLICCLPLENWVYHGARFRQQPTTTTKISVRTYTINYKETFQQFSVSDNNNNNSNNTNNIPSPWHSYFHTRNFMKANSTLSSAG